MKSSFVKEIEATENVVALLAKRKDIVEAVHDTFLSSEDVEVVERLCVALSDLYRGDERGRKLQRNGETPNNDNGHSTGRGAAGTLAVGNTGTGVATAVLGGPMSGSGTELLLNRRCLCLQFLPTILIRYLSLLVSQTSKEEMVLSLIEAFLVVICTSNTKKLSYSAAASKSASMNELDAIAGDNFVVVPNLLKPSVYMYNNEVLFAKDFISYPTTRVEVVKLRREPSISKLDSSNRQEVLTFSISQYNSYLSQFNLTSQKHFCHMCSCFVMSGFDMSKTRLASLASSPGRDGGRENMRRHFLNKRFVLSQSLMIEMLQGLYQLSFLLSLRDDCVSAVEHIAFRAKHSLMPQVIMLTHSVKKAIERSVLKQDETILSSPEVSFQDRVKAVTSDSLRITARRESIRLESANYYNSTLLSNGNTGGATATSSTAETEISHPKGHDLKGSHRGEVSDQIHPHSQQLRPSAAMQELEYYKLGSEAYLTKRHQQTTNTPLLSPTQSHYTHPNPPSSLHLDLTSSEGNSVFAGNIYDSANRHSLNVSQKLNPENSPRHSSNKTPTPMVSNGKEKSADRSKEGTGISSNQGNAAVVTQFKFNSKLQQNWPSESATAHFSSFSSKNSPRRAGLSKSGDTSCTGKKGGSHFFSKRSDSSSENSFCNRMSSSDFSGDQIFNSGGDAREDCLESKNSTSKSSKHKSAKFVIEDDEDSDRTLIDEYAGLMGSMTSTDSAFSSSFNCALNTNNELISSSGYKTANTTMGFKVSRDGNDDSSSAMKTHEVRSMVRSSIAAELNAENISRSNAAAPLAVVTEL